MGALQTFLRDALKKSPLMTNVILSLALVALEKITETEFICPCSPETNTVLSTGFFLIPFVLVFLLMMVTRKWGECRKCGACSECGEWRKCSECGEREKRIPCGESKASENCRECTVSGKCRKCRKGRTLVLCEKCKKCRERRSNCSQCLKNICISLIPAVVWLILMFMDGQYFACAKTTWSGRFVILDGSGTKKWCKPDESNLTEEDYKTQVHSWFSTSQVIGIGIAFVLTLALVGYATYLCCKPPTDNMLIQTKINNDQRYVKINKPSRDEYLHSAFKVFSIQHDKKGVKVFNGTGTEVDADVFEEVAQQSSAGVFTIRFDNETQEAAQPSCSSEATSPATPLLGATSSSPSAP